MDLSTRTVKKIPKMHFLGYGVGAIPINMSFGIVMMYLAYFYTDVFLLSPTVMAVLFVSCRVWDGITDPIMGIIADRTNTRWGKFRPYLLLMPIPMIVFAGLTFYVPDIGATAKVAWAFVTYFGLQMIKTAMAIPYMAMPALMTTDSTERTALTSANMIFVPIAFAIASGAALKIVGMFPSEKEGFFYMAIILVGFSAVFSFVTFYSTRRYDYPGNKLFSRGDDEKNISFKKNVESIIKNRPFIIVLCVFFVHNLATALIMGMAIYFYKYNLNQFDIYPVFMSLTLLSSVAGAAVSPFLVRKIGKKSAIQISNLVSLGAFALVYFLSIGKGQAQLIALWKIGGICTFLIFLASAAANVGGVVVLAFMADSVDYGEWKTGVRAQGFVTACCMIGNKAGMALGGALIGLGLSFSDYLPNLPEYSEKTLYGILVLFIFVPIICRILISVSMMFYNISDSRMNEIIKELNGSKKF